jgi:hypothetical protein
MLLFFFNHLVRYSKGKNGGVQIFNLKVKGVMCKLKTNLTVMLEERRVII